MMEFLHAVTAHSFMLNALLTGVAASIACGVVGTYVVSRRITYLAGGIAHSVLGGMGVARYLSVVKGWHIVQPLHGAIVAALLAALIIGWVSLRWRQREDTVIGAIWAIGMAVGIIFIVKTPGYNEDLMSYLFGNILMVSRADLVMIAVLDAVVLLVSILFYNQLLGVCFDQEFARIRGVHVEFFYLLLLGLTGLTVVILVSVVGLVMVIALLTLPVAVAGHFTRNLWQTMVVASLLSIVFTTLGLSLSYTPDLPAGATIILVAGAAYIIVVAATRIRRPHA
ncbi:MAG: metal ABC transporter permease [candidate division Zixibacteria bacterium]|nr:metal ABC transporter permease [candidate division Zixibacteria bacterium]